MSIKEDVIEMKKSVNEMKENVEKTQNNFDIGKTFRNIIYFLILLIVLLLGVIVFFIIQNNKIVQKNNELIKEISETTCETDIMEQEGLYNFIDSEGNMITTDADVLNKFIEEYYGKAKKNS